MKNIFWLLIIWGTSLWAAPRELPPFIYGVTLDRINSISSSVDSLRNFAVKPTTRLVFDEGMAASFYTKAVKSIYNVSYLMGELADSSTVAGYSVSTYQKRAMEYYDALNPYVDLWEVGNEINGEWLGSIPNVIQKLDAAYTYIHNKGGKTALTLYYNNDCYAQPENEMFTWIQNSLPQKFKDGIDYLLVSYYEQDCNNQVVQWEPVFQQLALLFPNSKLGMGETGIIQKSKKQALLQSYYKMKINHPRYVGGYFWWYFYGDMVPYTKTLWSTLNNIMKGL